MELVAFLANQLARGFLMLLAGIVLGKMLLGKISLRGIFQGDARDGHSYFSLGRLQLFLCVLAVTADYVILMITRARNALPEIRPVWLALFGGSALIYLAEKAFVLWSKPNEAPHERR